MPLTRLALTAISVLFIAAGCVSGPDRAIARRTIGQPPTDYRSRIRRQLGEYEGDYGPKYTRDYDFRDPVRAAYRPEDKRDWQYGYAVIVRVRSPVRQSGQIQRRPYVFFFNAETEQMSRKTSDDELVDLEEK